MSARAPLASVYFDCDSTLASIEGIDELLRGADESVRRDVLALTSQAMDGSLPLADVYEARLARVSPTLGQLREVGRHYVASCVPDAREVVAALQSLGLRVGIISGGLLDAVRMLGAHLGIDEADVHAVPLIFGERGDYRDFDRTCPLWRNGGKPELIRDLPADHHPMAFVGDGITDLETAPVVERFIGFGGVEARAAVRAGAEFWVDGPSLAGVLRHCLTAAQRATLAAGRFGALLS